MPHYARTTIFENPLEPEKGTHFIFRTEEKFEGDLGKLCDRALSS